jgi:uncharacterized membrane protein YgaE (UPF0421/DUF939 family)
LALRAGLGAAVAIGLAQLLKLEFPIYALIAAVIVTDFSPKQSSALGLQRLAATVVGAAIGALVRLGFEPSALAIGLSILVAMSVCQFVRLPGGAKVAGYIAGIIMLDHGEQPWMYAFYRLIETALGIVVAWLISLVPRLIRAPEPEHDDSAG